MSNNIGRKNRAAMGQEAKAGLVPKLRFPEFRNTGEWEKKMLGQISRFYKGKGISRADIIPSGHIPCIRYGELYTIYNEVINFIFSRTSLSKETLFFSLTYDIVMPASGETKIDIARASCVMANNVALGGDLNIIRSNQNGIFLSYYINGPLKFHISKLAQGDTIVHLYIEQLKSINFLIPSKQEQQKIAECLSSVDRLISAQAKKIDKLKAHKKGLMQKIFPKQDKKVPILRFPAFREAGEWEEKRLCELCDINPSGKTLPKIFFYIDLDSVKDGKLISKKQLTYENAPIRAKRILQYGDIIYQTVRPYQRNNLFFNINDEYSYVASTGYAQLRAYDNNKFLYQSLYTEEFINKIISKCTGSSYPAINFEDLKDICIIIPKISEQQKIAGCLSSLDELITAHTQKLDALKAHKKGLMQQLFPVPEEARAGSTM